MKTAVPRRLVIVLVCLAASTSCDDGRRTKAPGMRGGPTSADARAARPSGDAAGFWRELATASHAWTADGIRGRRSYAVDGDGLARTLQAAPDEHAGAEGAPISLPLPDGTYAQVRLWRSPVLSPELQARYPELQTYVLQGVDDPATTGRLVRVPAGFHAVLFSRGGTAVVTPRGGSEGEHVSYWERAGRPRSWTCGTGEPGEAPPLVPEGAAASAAALAPQMAAAPTSMSYGSQLRTYRLALNADAEFTAHLGGEAQATAQLVTTASDLTAFYEREAAIRFQLVYMKAYTDSATDPFTDGSVGAMLTQNQNDLDAKVGSANYDLGHVFFIAGEYGGNAPGKVCAPGSKARGASTGGIELPLGTAFSLGMVAHEMGHQLGASHTFSTSSSGQFAAATAYEVGDGCSMMSYDTICGGLDEDSDSAYYFHSASMDQIHAFAAAQGCGVLTPTGNQLPWIQGEPDCTAPRGTPLLLRSWGGDHDEDCHVELAGCPPTHVHEVLTYVWEQMDAAPSPVDGYPSPTATAGPLFMSWVPLPPHLGSSERIIPSIESILTDTPSKWEVLPAVDRTLHFRAIVRDNRPGGGGVSYVSTTVNIAGDPVLITSPEKNDVAECGEYLYMLWDKGGSAAPSMDVGFETYDPDWSSALWVGTTDNDGTYAFKPWTATTHARVTLSPSPTSCYTAYSERFTVVDTQPPTVTAPPDVTAECTSPGGTAVDIGKATVTDKCDWRLEAKSDAPSLFPLGTTYVTWESTDKAGNPDLGFQDVIVRDTTPPTLVPPPDVTVECASPAGTAVSLGKATASDACDASVVPASDAPALFPPGSTTVHWTAVDGSGNKSAANSGVTVKDTTAPTLSCNAPASMIVSSVPVSFTATASDTCKGSLPVTITGYDCYGFNKLGKRITKQCAATIQGGTITITDSGGIGASIDWNVSTADGSGNVTAATCHTVVVKK